MNINYKSKSKLKLNLDNLPSFKSESNEDKNSNLEEDIKYEPEIKFKNYLDHCNYHFSYIISKLFSLDNNNDSNKLFNIKLKNIIEEFNKSIFISINYNEKIVISEIKEAKIQNLQIYRLIIKEFDNLKKLITNDKELNKIIEMKLRQNKICYNPNNSINLEEKILVYFNKLNKQFSCNIDKKILKKKLYLVEFKKFMKKKYNKKLIIRKSELFNKIVYENDYYMLKLYKEFMINRYIDYL